MIVVVLQPRAARPIPVQMFINVMVVDRLCPLLNQQVDIDSGVRVCGDVPHTVGETPPLRFGATGTGDAPLPPRRLLGHRTRRPLNFAAHPGLALHP